VLVEASSHGIEGATDEPGKDIRRSTQKIMELTPGQKVIWHVTDSRLNFVERKTEWTCTGMVFEIARKDGKTELRFTHVGLVSAFECYGGGSGASGFYTDSSLHRLITTGKGQRIRKESGSK
jgi:hypothetical protein